MRPPIKYLSVCSGIEAATCAWHHMGWQPAGFSEIEPFPSAVLAHHYPQIPNLGDMTKYKEWDIGAIDLLVGGTPCQSFSVAGLRKGLEDPRGNLALVYCGILDHFKPRWFVWENVPGVLSSNGGRDFGSFLGAVAELGYGFAYRVLDAQYFGVAQRRRRVFVVGHLGDWEPAAKVLFEPESLRGNPAPSREKGKEVAGRVTHGLGIGGECARALTAAHTATGRLDPHEATFISQMQPVAVDVYNQAIDGQTAATLTEAWGGTNTSGPKVMQPIGTDCYNGMITGDISMTLKAAQGNPAVNHPTVIQSMAVRRLTPVECERLQGFPDNYTEIPWRSKTETPDGPRYKALGNSMAVPVMKWIGERILGEENETAH